MKRELINDSPSIIYLVLTYMGMLNDVVSISLGYNDLLH